MNIGQQETLNLITRNISGQIGGSNNRLHLFITGQAGTVVKVGALSEVAARLVRRSTLHSMLKLPVQKDGRIVQMPLLSGQYLQHMRLEWKDVEFIFIDEISMVPYEMLCMIEFRLRQLKSPEEMFGEINVLLFGDLMQIPLVKRQPVFSQSRHMIPATHLWELFTLIELTQNMRQQGDTTFFDVLNALRIGELTTSHMFVLMSRVSTETDGEFSIEKAMRIYPTNKQVEAHSNKVLQYFREKNVEMFTIRALDSLVDATRPLKNSIDTVISDDINKTGGLPRELVIFVSTKVMLRSNIDVQKGLVNGTIGFVTELKWAGGFRRGQIYKQDIPGVMVDFGVDGIHLIKPKSIQFPEKFSYGTAERRMLPLILSWASTAHKMQGTTVDYAVVYLGRKLFVQGQAYVIISRVRSFNGLHTEELDASKITGKTSCNVDALDEIERMRQRL
ncbi:ATP-dependent DNA helicase PIF1-like [Acyrthosiphon pisum]|uniref:ATP-dependent DNA helicase n=1 Tax=Acyrthosiphon pisum TaxID=7029 RepID=A0A8R2F9U2_ACYPI|nr:ATP-dependent DNA helicase PIF1-like [Acyrthosiphon pisum]|eukprot:XP_008184877.1 PREDICTED: ATP-dependent DNA helicase PIF1-like [Acyrthosiphon pisum]